MKILFYYALLIGFAHAAKLEIKIVSSHWQISDFSTSRFFTPPGFFLRRVLTQEFSLEFYEMGKKPGWVKTLDVQETEICHIRTLTASKFRL